MRRAATSRALALIMAASTVYAAACTTADRAAADTAASAMVSDTGAWQDGDEHIAWSSEIVDGAITEITEQVTFGTDGRAERLLRFTPSGQLAEYREVRTQTVQNPAASPSTMRVEMTATFAGDSVVSHTKTVDGAAADVQPYEVDNMRRHAAATLQQLRLPDSSAPARD